MPKECLPEHLRKLHTDWPWPFCYIPRGWTAWCWGKPKYLYGNQVREKGGYPLPIGEPGSWQISCFPLAPWWSLYGLYFAMTLKNGRHFRIGARWDDVDNYVQWPSVATRWFPPNGNRETS